MITPIFLLFASNIFMTFAWYGHLKTLKDTPLHWVILISWGIALFEYALQVPANRWGSENYSLPQLKIMQETITMVVFAGFSYFFMKQPLKLDYLWASLCLVGAIYFVFRAD
ncbi:MAG: DMT family protein [Pseudobdellovibrionaceae bacterium]